MQELPQIIVVDDEQEVLQLLSEQLCGEGYQVRTFSSPHAALSHLTTNDVAVIISDQKMPEMAGLEFLNKSRLLCPDASRILVTGLLSLEIAIEAINHGEIFRFLNKPWLRAELLATISNAVQRWQLFRHNQQLERESRALNEQLDRANHELRLRINEVDEKNKALRSNFDQSLQLCYRIVNTFYPLLGQHTKAVVEICERMIQTPYFTEQEKHVLMVSAWLHDIGLVGVRRETLHASYTRPESLTVAEKALIRNHPAYGQAIASFVDSLDAVGATIRAHHEHFDGSGYPDGLAGESIPRTARYLAVAVAFAESPLNKSENLAQIERRSGKAFDPEAVRLFYKVMPAHNLPKQVRELMLDELQPGMRLATGLCTPTGMLLVGENQPLSSSAIAKLRNHNIASSLTQRLLVYT